MSVGTSQQEDATPRAPSTPAPERLTTDRPVPDATAALEGTGNKYFVLRRSPIQGLGGFATRDIRKGTRIIEYLGERIRQKEADRRYDDDAMERHHTFLFALDSGWIIDAAVNGNEARFINHSCDPNCEAVEQDDRIFIEAKRTIRAGEELVYDYSFSREDVGDGPEVEAHYACRCGAANCRGTILAPPKKKRKTKAASKSKSKTRQRTRKSGAKTKKSGAKTKRGGPTRAKKSGVKTKQKTRVTRRR